MTITVPRMFMSNPSLRVSRITDTTQLRHKTIWKNPTEDYEGQDAQDAIMAVHHANRCTDQTDSTAPNTTKEASKRRSRNSELVPGRTVTFTEHMPSRPRSAIDEVCPRSSVDKSDAVTSRKVLVVYMPKVPDDD